MTARMAGLLAEGSIGWVEHLLNIGSPPPKQGKFPVTGRKNNGFAVLDLALARIVNGARLLAVSRFCRSDIYLGDMGP